MKTKIQQVLLPSMLKDSIEQILIQRNWQGQHTIQFSIVPKEVIDLLDYQENIIAVFRIMPKLNIDTTGKIKTFFAAKNKALNH